MRTGGTPPLPDNRARGCATKTAWATLHTVKRHGGKVEDVVVPEVEVPRAWLRRNRRGLWYSCQDIPPAPRLFAGTVGSPGRRLTAACNNSRRRSSPIARLSPRKAPNHGGCS